jgi:hypothetical protein
MSQKGRNFPIKSEREKKEFSLEDKRTKTTHIPVKQPV